jgi:hypothetical protein
VLNERVNVKTIVKYAKKSAINQMVCNDIEGWETVVYYKAKPLIRQGFLLYTRKE